MPITQTINVTTALMEAYGIANEKRNEFLTPEHLLAGYLKDCDFWEVMCRCGRPEELENDLYDYINKLDKIPDDQELSIDFSSGMQQIFETAGQTAGAAMVQTIHTHHIIFSLLQLEDSFAVFYLEKCLDCSIPEFLNSLTDMEEGEMGAAESQEKPSRFLTDLKPREIIGMKDESDKVLRVLCRKTRSNVLIVGGRGVGKSTLAAGIAQRMEKGSVPARISHMTIKELNIPLLLSGTQYRGDLEGRVQSIMDNISKGQDHIVYIDDLRSLGGTSKTDDGSKDILSLLIPYMKSGDVKFIICASPEDIKRLGANDNGAFSLMRQIEVQEPSTADAEKILKGIIPDLSQHHGVKYEKDVVAHTIELSRRYIQDRCLPDKAIDLLDEAGAYSQARKLKTVTKQTVNQAIADICRIDVMASDEETREDLYNMEDRLGSRIYGQSKAIRQVSEAILMSKAGLLDSDKTVASFLFVGPTGVGKTELSKVLAQQLHVPLHRFDMSEYSEKHSVAKLIGSPAGYVGYDDGGILTDTIRKNPYCVLLLDEIEKAHEDIYNLLLQVMDYAVISDNKGRKVDFRNVVLIMTSNAGARYAHKAAVGFDRTANAGEAMAKEVKSIFAPEFINRLTSVVVFNDMDKTMAGLILDDKIKKLQNRLDPRKITLSVSEEAYEALLKEGFSPTYGAREIERVLNARLTPLLMKEILFGRKENFTAEVKYTDGEFSL